MPHTSPDLTDFHSQNSLRWLDMERAYQFVEQYAPYSITGDVQAFARAVFERRIGAALADSKEPLPEPAQEVLQAGPTQVGAVGLDTSALKKANLAEVDIAHILYAPDVDERFRKLADEYGVERPGPGSGRLFGYGTDGYGTYLPLHLLWPDHKHWGIYISEQMLIDLAVRIFNHWTIRRDTELLPIPKLLDIAYQAILRHELFHFKIEQWVLWFELVTGRAYYLPYLANVYLPTLFDENDTNLEEALANASIRLSRKIDSLAGDKAKHQVKVAIDDVFLRGQGPGYRNYDLRSGFPYCFEDHYRQAVNYLCNQIARADPRPTQPLVPFFIYPPNNNFLRAENLVPIRIVRNIPLDASVIGLQANQPGRGSRLQGRYRK